MFASEPRPKNTGGVRKFCETHGAWNKITDEKGDRLFTHLDLSSYNGGIINVPDVYNHEFLVAVAEDIDRGDSLFLVECRTDTFPFFCDLDIKIDEDKRPTDMNFLIIIREIVWDIARFYPAVDESEGRDLFRCIIASSPDKKLSSSSGESGAATKAQVKVGFHLYFPNLLVNQEQALLIHASAASRLDRKVRILPDGESWENALDPCVYKTNGLRMIESDKCSDCPRCKNKKAQRNNCTLCVAKGRLAENRPYSPMCTLDGLGVPDDEFTETLYDTVAMVKATSIRAPGASADSRFKRYDGSPTPYPINMKKSGKNVEIASRATQLPGDKKFPDGIGLKRSRDPICATEVYDSVGRVIKNQLPEVYRNLEVKSATYTDGKKTALWLRVKGEGSNYCQNKKGDHNSNTVWFLINQKGIAQRCFSGKVCHGGRCCSNYTSECIPIPQREINILFPAVTKTEKRKRALVDDHALQPDNDEHEEVAMSKLIHELEIAVFGADAARGGNSSIPKVPVKGQGRKRIVRSYDTTIA